jgi:hypothetical protein
MTLIKRKLILLGALVLSSFLVIGNFRFISITYPALLIYVPVLIYTGLRFCRSLLIQVLLAVAGLCCLGLGAIFLFRFVLCGYGDKRTEYTSRKYTNIKLVGRDFSCFGTSGDLILYKEYSLAGNMGIEIYYTTFPDYRNVSVDTAIWKRAGKQ